jgi:hypothetical protein
MPGIDSALLDFTERLCRRFQLLTGRTNVWLAVQLTNLSIIVYFVTAAVYFPSVRLLGVRIAIALFCSGVLYVLTQTVFKVSIEAAENNAYARVAKGLRNPRRLRDAQLRVSFLTLSVLMLYPLVLIYLITRVSIALLSYSLIVRPGLRSAAAMSWKAARMAAPAGACTRTAERSPDRGSVSREADARGLIGMTAPRGVGPAAR